MDFHARGGTAELARLAQGWYESSGNPVRP